MAVATDLARVGPIWVTGLDRVGDIMVIATATVDRASAIVIMVRKSIVAVGTEIGTVVSTTGTNSGSVFSPETRLLLTSWRASPIAGLSFMMRLSSVS